MKVIHTCLTVNGNRVFIYDMHFKYPDNPLTTFWVASLGGIPSARKNGFLIDGKRLCFTSENDFYDIDMLTYGLDWLIDLRKLAENTNNPHC